MFTQVHIKQDSVVITVEKPIVKAFKDTAMCPGLSVPLNAVGAATYHWSPAAGLSNVTIANPVATPVSSTQYIVAGTTGNGCVASDTVNVTVYQKPVVTRSNDTVICKNSSVQLLASGGASYSWSPVSSLNNNTVFDPVATPFSTTTYIVTATDAYSCQNSDSVMVSITGAGQSGYLMPSAFTPNNDGLNDCYGIKYWGVIEELDFGIYNRWGERIFHTSNPGDCWDGTFKGIKQNPDVYVYMITAKTYCAKVFRKGTFVLIR